MKSNKLILGILNSFSLFLGGFGLILSFTPLRMLALYPAGIAFILAIISVLIIRTKKLRNKVSYYAAAISGMAIVIILLLSFAKKTEIDTKDDLSQKVEQDSVSLDEEFAEVMQDSDITESDIFDEPEDTGTEDEVFEEESSDKEEFFEEQIGDTPFDDNEEIFEEQEDKPDNSEIKQDFDNVDFGDTDEFPETSVNDPLMPKVENTTKKVTQDMIFTGVEILKPDKNIDPNTLPDEEFMDDRIRILR